MNTIVIQQEAKDVALAVEVHKNATLSKIRLSQSKLSSNRLGSNDHESVSVEFKYKGKAIEIGKDELVVEVSFSMVGVDADVVKPSEKQQIVVRVDCVFEAAYEINPEFVLTKEHAEAFLSGNAIFNTWPYFREYLQSSLTRMGYPALVAPFLVMRPKPKKPVKNTPKLD